MLDTTQDIISVNIEDELKQSYLDYAMSVIVGRALPDVRDGLKPVHRRCLFAMYELKNDWNKPYKKSARIVGDVIGKYHPHGDSSVYDAIVRLVQPFSMRYSLVDGQGNFGSVDGDMPAAMRYTEVRMSHLTHLLLQDLEKETVDLVPNYDESEFAPSVLPACFPNLLVNGSSGIAVGMATNIPPHNLTEILNACLAIIKNPGIEFKDLCQYVSGPDFPTAGIINGCSGIIQAYKTGRGRVLVRGRVDIETHEQHESIIVTELPYQVNKARLIEKIAELVKTKRIEGITGIRDESDKDGMRIVIQIRRGDSAEVILNNLYAQTQLQNTFSINMVVLNDDQPCLLNLKQLLEAFIRHRREVVTRRTVFDLRKARERAHVLEGLSIAISNIDEVIALIKQSDNPTNAKAELLACAWQLGQVCVLLNATDEGFCRPEGLKKQFGMSVKSNHYRLSPVQAQAILDLRLHRLTGLEQSKIISEYKSIIESIKTFLEILREPSKLMQVIRDELIEVRQQFGDERRTEIIDAQLDLRIEDLITEEELVITLTQDGYVKTQPVDLYQAQRRGGKGKQAAGLKTEDFISCFALANSHDMILCFSSIGKVYWRKAYEFPQGGRTSRGRPMVNLFPLTRGEYIQALLSIGTFDEDHCVVFATANGTVKKVCLEDFSRPRTNGIIAIDLLEGDHLVDVGLTDGNSDILLFSNGGKVIRFDEKAVRAIGRTGRGVRGMKLSEGQKVIALIISNNDEGAILTATKKGYGKRTVLSDYRRIGRGAQGVITIQVNERNGEVISAVKVFQGDEVMLLTNGGTMVRTRVDEISLVGRAAQGVRLINLSDGEQLTNVRRIEELNDDTADDASDEDASNSSSEDSIVSQDSELSKGDQMNPSMNESDTQA